MEAKPIEVISTVTAGGYSKMNPEIVAYAKRVGKGEDDAEIH